MKIGSLARVVQGGKGQGAKFLDKVGLVLDCTRSLNPGNALVYFLWFDDLGIRAWFEEQQIIEVRPCRSDEDDPAA